MMVVVERTAGGDYAVYIVRNGRRKHLGTFPTHEAAEAWAWMALGKEVMQ